MARFDLATLTRRAKKTRRAFVPMRPIKPPTTRATDLFREAYAPVIAAWADGEAAILVEYKRSLLELTTDSPAQIEAEIGKAERDALATLVAVRLRIERWARAVEAWHRSRWRATVISATGVDLATLIGPEDMRETLEQVIARNTGLVRSISDQARQRIADAVFRGLTNRTPVPVIAREIREAVEMGRRRALNIAADQTVKITASLNDERRRQAGIPAWEWIHSDKRNPRPEHDARDGFLYTDDPEQVGGEYEGKRLRKPPEDRPGQLPYCGCTARALLLL